jgi:hypothetical protein
MTSFAPPPKKPARPSGQARRAGARPPRKQVDVDCQTVGDIQPPQQQQPPKFTPRSPEPDTSETIYRHCWAPEPPPGSPLPAPLPAPPPLNFAARTSERLGGGSVASLLRADESFIASPMRALLPGGSPRCGGLIAGPSAIEVTRAVANRARLREDLEAQIREKKEAEILRKKTEQEQEAREEAQFRARLQRAGQPAAGAPAAATRLPPLGAPTMAGKRESQKADAGQAGACMQLESMHAPTGTQDAVAVVPADSSVLLLLAQMQAHQAQLQERLAQQEGVISSLQHRLLDSQGGAQLGGGHAAAGRAAGLLAATSELIPLPKTPPRQGGSLAQRRSSSVKAAARSEGSSARRQARESKRWVR